jgi:hypothetical protein
MLAATRAAIQMEAAIPFWEGGGAKRGGMTMLRELEGDD